MARPPSTHGPAAQARAEALAQTAYVAVCRSLQTQLSPLVVPAFFDAAPGPGSATLLRSVTGPMEAALRTAGAFGLPSVIVRSMVRQWLVFVDAMLFNGLLTRRPLTSRGLANVNASLRAWNTWLAQRQDQMA